ncbi:MAG: hypothetical protein LYZ69_07605 [Nitrososphaerales archaeon]|nr:hypothetical protein [Nitrososphaerales archaeon]
MTSLESVLGTLVTVFAVLAVVGFYLARLYYQRWQTRQSKAFQIGGNQAKGDVSQVLGTFAVLDEYEQIILLSSTSKQGSFDLLGVKDEVSRSLSDDAQVVGNSCEHLINLSPLIPIGN